MRPFAASAFDRAARAALALLCLPACAFAMEFRLLSWQGDIADLKYDERGKAVAITATEYSLSETYRKTDVSTPLELYRETRANDGRLLRQVVARIAPPEPGLSRALLLLAPAPQGYSGRWLDDSLAAHPANTLRLYNFSSRPLAVQACGEQWRQAPGQSHRVAFDPAARQVVIRIAVQTDSGWELVAGGPQPVRKNSRVYLLVRDFRPPDKSLMREVRSTDLVDLILLHDPVRPPPSGTSPEQKSRDRLSLDSAPPAVSATGGAGPASPR